MNRITLTDGTGRWFNQESAEHFPEVPAYDGNNNRHSRTSTYANGTEALYRTKGGKWIKQESFYSGETWEAITDHKAAIWLSINEYDGHPACQSEFDGLEIA